MLYSRVLFYWQIFKSIVCYLFSDKDTRNQYLLYKTIGRLDKSDDKVNNVLSDFIKFLSP